MALPLQPLTELDAVNSMLMSIGETPVNTLEEPGISAVSIARDVLHQTSRQVQAGGLWCNSEENYPLSLSVDGHILLPANTLKVSPVDKSQDIVQRGKKLYDRRNHTYIFKRPLKVNIVFFLPFEELPQVVRDYITVRAGRVFQAKVVGSNTLYEFTVHDEQQAYLELMREEIDAGNHTMFDSVDIKLNLRRI